METSIRRSASTAAKRFRTSARRGRERASYTDPLAWAAAKGIRLWGRCNCSECGGFHPEHGDEIAIWESVRDNRETYVHAGHAVGKTWSDAALAAWWMDAFNDSMVVTTASEWLQVKNQLWADLRSLHRQLGLEGEIHYTHWYPDPERNPKHIAYGISTQEPERFQGAHGARILVIIDEGSGVEETIYDTAHRIMTGPDDRLLVSTNPLRLASVTYERMEAERGNHIRITVPDCLAWQDAHAQHGIDDLVSHTWVEEMREFHGEESVHWRIHVDGLYPETDESYLFPPDLVAEAMRRFEVMLKEGDILREQDGVLRILASPDQMGVDVAGVGRNKTCWASRWDKRAIAILKVEAKTKHRQHRLEIQDFHQQHRPRIWVFDAVGIGEGTESELEATEVPIDGFVGGELPEEPTVFKNRRAEAYFALRDFLFAGGALQPNVDLKRQLQAVEAVLDERNYEGDRYTVYKLVPKEKLKRTTGSPDEADACAMAATPTTWSGEPETMQVRRDPRVESYLGRT